MRTAKILPIILACSIGTLLPACQLEMEPMEGDIEESDVESVSHALSLGAALGHSLASGSTCGLNNSVTPICAISTASDMTYEWTAPSAGTFTFTTTGSGTNFNTALQVASYTSPSTIVGCNDNVSSTNDRSSLSLSLSSGTKLLVEIDGHASLCGNYQLGITKNCTSSCNTPPPCHEPQGTCTVSGTCSYVPLCDASELCRSGECIPRCLIDPRFPC